MEHHSNIVPWQLLCARTGATLRVAPIDDRGELLHRRVWRGCSRRGRRSSRSRTSRTRSARSTRSRRSSRWRAAAARRADRRIAGRVSHGRSTSQALGADFYVFTGHKLYGPTGIGVLYGREAVLEAMPPFLGGGDMIRTVTFEGSTWNDLPYKFEAGTPNIAGAIGLGAAIDYVASDRVRRASAARSRRSSRARRRRSRPMRRRPHRRHGATEGERRVVRDGRRAPARHRHDRRSRGRRDSHRPSLRAAGHGSVRHSGDRARVVRDVQHASTRWTRSWRRWAACARLLG